MNLEELQRSNKIIYEVVSGSHAYSTNIATSDTDLRGYYWVPKEDFISLIEPKEQIDNEKQDIVYYSLKRAFELLSVSGPNQIELLWIPEDCIRIKHPIMDVLLKNRNLFISKKAYYTHAAYSIAQVAKAKGKNKKVHNPCPKEMPKKEDFCRVIDMRDEVNYPNKTIQKCLFLRKIRQVCIFFNHNLDNERFPFRPISLKESKIDLSKCHVSSLEHVSYAFRLYEIGDKANGVFRGDQMLCCESISKKEEVENFIGLLIYNKEEFDRALKDWHSYHDWIANRNDARWESQEKGLLTYDQKNMMHCMRLLISAENILRNGEPLVRFDGDRRNYLMKIRNGEFKYEEIMAEVERRRAILDDLFKTSTIPEQIDKEKVNNLYKELMDMGLYPF